MILSVQSHFCLCMIKEMSAPLHIGFMLSKELLVLIHSKGLNKNRLLFNLHVCNLTNICMTPVECSLCVNVFLFPSYYHPQRSWGKVIFSQASVILSTGGCVCLLGGVPALGVVPGPGGCMLGGGCLVPGGCLGGWWRPPRDGFCFGRYASYWNAFLSSEFHSLLW